MVVRRRSLFKRVNNLLNDLNMVALDSSMH